MHIKRLICTGLAIGMAAAVFSGCNRAPQADLGDHMKFTINVLDAEKHGQDAAYEYLTEKFNVEFEFYPISFADWGEKVKIWAAADDMPEIMWTNTDPASYPIFMDWVTEGLIREIPSLDPYPNLKFLAEKMPSVKDIFTIDGKLYSWPSSTYKKDVVGGENSNNQFFYRRDWAEKLGMANPNDEYTFEEFAALGKAFVEKDPGGNGPGKTVGMGSTTWAFPQVFGIIQQNPNWDTHYIRDGKFVWGMADPETLDGIKTVKKLLDDGTIWEDMLMAKGNEAKDKFIAGQSGVYYGGWSISTIDDVRKNIKAGFPDVDVDTAVVPMFVKMLDGRLQTQRDGDFWSNSVFRKDLDDKKMQRLLQIFDWVASDEGFEYATKGVKGIDWHEEDGEPVLNPQDLSKVNHIMNTIVRSTGAFLYLDPRLPQAAVETSRKSAARYAQDDVYVRVLNSKITYFSAPEHDRIGVMYGESVSKMKEILFNSTNIEKDWNDYLDSVKDKSQPVLDEYNTILLPKM